MPSTFLFLYDINQSPSLISGRKGKIAEYYKKQERLLEGFNEMEVMHESGCLPTNLTEVGVSHAAAFYFYFDVCLFLRKK